MTHVRARKEGALLAVPRSRQRSFYRRRGSRANLTSIERVAEIIAGPDAADECETHTYALRSRAPRVADWPLAAFLPSFSLPVHFSSRSSIALSLSLSVCLSRDFPIRGNEIFSLREKLELGKRVRVGATNYPGAARSTFVSGQKSRLKSGVKKNHVMHVQT